MLYILLFFIIFSTIASYLYHNIGLAVNDNKKTNESAYSDTIENYVTNVETVYDNIYTDFHMTNYRAYVENNIAERYNGHILLGTGEYCSWDKDTNTISNCVYLDTIVRFAPPHYIGDINPDREVIKHFMPPKTSSLDKIIGVAFNDTSSVQANRTTFIPKENIYVVDVKKDLSISQNYIVNKIYTVDTSSIVINKIKKADMILDNISEFVRMKAKVNFKKETADPFTSEFGLTNLQYNNGSGNTRYVRVPGSLDYGIISSGLFSLNNRYNYSSVIQTYISTVPKFYMYLEGSIFPSTWSNSQDMTLYTVGAMSTAFVAPFADTYCGNSGWDTNNWKDVYNYDYSHFFSSPLYTNSVNNIYDKISTKTKFASLDDRYALKKEVAFDSANIKTVTLQQKRVRDYFVDSFKIDFCTQNYRNPFYGDTYIDGKKIPFDILIDNTSNFLYKKEQVNIDTFQIVDGFKIMFAIPYVYDHIDDSILDQADLDDETSELYNNVLEGLYFKIYEIKTVG
jgi:hypothetical protein